MANYFPLFLDTGSIEVTNFGAVLNYINFPVTFSASASYLTRLPDPYYFQTQSTDLTNASSATSTSLFEFTLPNTREQYYYTTDVLLGVQSTAGGTGVRVGLQTQNNADGILALKAGSISLTAFTYLYKGSQDNFTFVLPGTTTATNTTYPSQVKAILTNSTAGVGNFRNVVLLQSETANTVTAMSGSIVYNQYIGYSSSLQPVSSSQSPLIYSGSRLTVLESTDLLTQSILPTTQSLWISQSLVANVTTTDAVAYSNVFTLPGLLTNQRYLVNFYLIGASAATTTGLQVRVVTGSFYRGSTYSPTSATALAIQNSEDGTNITNLSTAWPVTNTKALVYGEYTFMKGATDPAIQVRSEIDGSAITVFSGSAVFYRLLN